jgi:hypothetical protein
MDRQIIYPGQIPLETDLLNTNKNAMIGLSKLAAAMLGTSTVVNGLTVGPNSPAALNVVVSAGEIYALTSVDANAYSSIAADTTHLIVKQGISLDPTTISCPAPTTSGFSINYLIQVAFSETDGSPVALPYYNSSNPSQAFSGPGNNGAAQNTRRYGLAVVNAKAGVAAATGTQTTPSADAGFVGLAVVTVANGQSTIAAGNITPYAGAPVLPSDLLHAIQASSLTVGVDTGAANGCVVNYSYPVTALKDGMPLWFKPAAANTGAATLNVNGLGAFPLIGGAHLALTGGEIIPGGKAQVVWRADINSFILIECTGGALQVAPGTGSQHAPQMSQVAGIVGSMRNLVMNVAAASSAATLTADEIVVETALGGVRYCLPNFNKTINVGTTGAGGMDTGTSPLNGYVAIYAIYNPATGASALLGKNATSAVQPNVYGGANMPAGYTASALVSVVPTDGSGNIKPLYQRDRDISIASAVAFTTSTTQASPTSFSISGLVPPNGVRASGNISISSTVASNMSTSIYPTTGSLGGQSIAAAVSAGFSSACNANWNIATPQTLYYTAASSAGTPTFTLTIGGYSI